MGKKNGVKRLYFDIEVSPNVGLFWTAGYKQNIDYDNILQERAIICICYKWPGEKPQYLTWDKNHCDKAMLEKFIKIANQADELVGHNGDKFDLAWIRTRCLLHKISMFPTYTTVDTLKVARSKFRFNSNRLDYLGKFLGIGKKIKTGGFGLWKDVMNDNKSALDKMVKYCKGDVSLLEKVHLTMANHIQAKNHAGVARGGTKTSCPECGSEKTSISKTRITATGMKKIQLQCGDCGKYHSVSASVIARK